jgi:hypothetical protein
MDHKEIFGWGGMYWINLAHDGDHTMVFVNTTVKENLKSSDEGVHSEIPCFSTPSIVRNFKY